MDLANALVNSSAKFRKEVLFMPIAALMDKVLAHMTLRQGVRGDETVGAASSDAELRPYKSEKGATDTTKIIARTLTTFLGDVVEEFDPYLLFTTVYGEQFSDLTDRKEADIVKTLSLAQAKKISKKLAKALFSAVRNPNGTTTATLFNGFDTIAATEITAGNLSIAKGNYIEVATITEQNAGDVLKAIYDAASDELEEAEELRMYVPKSVKKMYEKWCLAEFGAVVYNNTYNKNYLHGTEENPVQIVGMTGLAGSNYIYLTSKNNMLVGCDQRSSQEKVKIRECDNPKALQFFMCMFFGVQFEMIEPEFLLVAKQVTVTPSPVTVSGDDEVELAAAANSAAVRTYATSNGSSVDAEVTSENSSWLTVSASGNKVTFTAAAYAYSADAADPRTATVKVKAHTGSGYITVTVKQAMAENV